MKFKLLQIKNTFDCPYAFMSYSFAKKYNFNLADYECTYEMDVDSDHSLDDFYEMFNIDRPEDFKGRSMSVSDIIDLDGHKYYCDSSSWAEIK